MRSMYYDNRNTRQGRKLIILLCLLLAVCVVFIYFSYMFYSARALGEDVKVSWMKLERTLETKAEAMAVLSGFLVRKTGSGRSALDITVKAWDDIISAEAPGEKLDAGVRINSESYGIIAMARAYDGSGLNERVRRVLEDFEPLELRLAADIEKYNMSVESLRSEIERHYFRDFLMAFSGAGDFDNFGVRHMEKL